jgi:hypothetical protein
MGGTLGNPKFQTTTAISQIIKTFDLELNFKMYFTSLEIVNRLPAL